MMWLKCDGKFGETQMDYYDPVSGLWIWHDSVDGNYYMTTAPGRPMDITDGGSVQTVYPSGYLYTGRDYYYLSVYPAGWYVWTDGGYYYISQSLGHSILEYSRSSGVGVTTWHGNTWWRSGGESRLGIYNPRGLNKDINTDKTIAYAQIQGRFKTQAGGVQGEYVPVEGSAISGNKYIGLNRYDVSYSTSLLGPQYGIFTQTLDDYLSKPMFAGCDSKALWYHTASGKYVISSAAGSRNELTGYWQSSDISGTYTRVFTQAGDPPAVAPEPESYIVTFKDCVLGNETKEVYHAQV
jgi:hypothetical protein